MAKKRKQKVVEQHSVFGGASDLVFEPKQEKDLAEGLFSVLDAKSIIDGYEQTTGVAPKKKQKTPYVKNIILDLDKERDRKLLERLMNEPRYSILSWEKSWSSLGRLRAFVIYTDSQVEDNTTK